MPRQKPLRTVDRQQAMPLYHQIYLQVREDITSGKLPYGAKISTEKELAALFDVSRITARRALEELSNHKYVDRRRRTGTHVIYQSPSRPIEGSIDQALETLVAFGRATRVKILEYGEVEAEPPVSTHLEIQPGVQVLRVSRVRSSSDGPLGHMVSWVPQAFASEINRAELGETPMLTLIARAGVEIGGAQQTITAALADGQLAQILDVDIGTPLLRVTRVVRNRDKQPVQYIHEHYRSDKYQIRLELGASGGPLLDMPKD